MLTGVCRCQAHLRAVGTTNPTGTIDFVTAADGAAAVVAAAAAAAAGVAVFLSTAAPALWATPAIHTWLLDSP